MNFSRFLQIKQLLKLNDNATSPKRGEAGYDPAYKYDYAFKVIIENCNAFTEKADLDLTGDETTFAHNSYGEPNSGLVSRVIGKPNVTKGMQTVLVCNAYRNHSRAYYHRYKCHKEFSNKKRGCITAEDPSGFRIILESIKLLIQGNQSKGRHQIFPQHPNFTWENNFSGDGIPDWCGKN